jgi:SAM-dependent methyltransferase
MSDTFEDAWRERFGEFAELSDDDAGIAGWTEGGLAARLRRFRELFGERQVSGCWLDAGCGAGTYSRYLVSRGAFVVGLDYSYLTVAKAHQRATDGISFVVADVSRLPMPSRTLAGALCFGVTQALSNSSGAVTELRRCLRPGGELWIDGLNRYCVPNALRSGLRRMRGKPAHLRYERPWAMMRLLKTVGLADVRLHWMPIMPGPLKRFQWLAERAPTRFLLKYLPPLSALICHAFIVTARCR